MKRTIGSIVGLGTLLVASQAFAAPTWATLADIEVGGVVSPRSEVATCKLSNDIVLVAGGRDAGGAAVDDTVLYDPSTDTWADTFDGTNVTVLPAARADGKMVRTAFGTCLYVGGVNAAGQAEDEIFEYDEALQTWVQTDTLTQTRTDFAIVDIDPANPGERFMILGGDTNGGFGANTYRSRVEMLNGATGVATDLLNGVNPVNLNVARSKLSAIAVNTGGANTEVFAIGGEISTTAAPNDVNVTSNVESITVNAAASTFVSQDITKDPLLTGRRNAIVFNVAKSVGGVTRDFLITGGDDGFNSLLSTEFYDVGTDDWNANSGAQNLPAPTSYLQVCESAAVANDFIVAGGAALDALNPGDAPLNLFNTVSVSLRWDAGNQDWDPGAEVMVDGPAKFGMECLQTTTTSGAADVAFVAGGYKAITGTVTTLDTAQRSP